MRERQIDLIDWTQPVNWDHPLNEGLVSAWLAVPNKTGFGTATWRDLCGRNHGTLSGMDAASDWIADATGGRWGHLNFAGTDTQSVQITSSTSIMSGQPQYTLLSLFRTSSRYGSNQILHGERRASGDAWIVKLNIGATDQAPGVNWPNGLTAGSLELAVQQNDGTYRLVGETYGVNLVDGEWHVGAGVRDGNNAYVYYTSGGQIHSIGPVDISAISYTNSTSTPSYNIARDLSDNVGYFNGDQAAAWIYHKAFSFDDFKAFNDQVNNFYPDLFRRVKQPRFFVPSGGGVTVSPSAASTTLTATIGVVVLGSISITPSESTTTLTAVSPTVVLGSISITPSESTTTLTATIGTVSVGGIEISPSAASTTLSASSPTIVLGSISITPNEATTTLTASSPTVVLGSITIPGSFSAGLVAASSQYYTGTTIAFGTSDFAIAFWIYLNDTTGVKTVVSLGSVTNGVEHLWLAVSGTSLFMSLNDSVQATRLTHTFGAGFTAGWNHIVVNFDRSANATCWINGTAPTAPTKDISTYSASMNPTTFYVGRKVSGSDYFDGRIDKLVYANSILDSGDIAELVSETRLLNLSSSLAAKIVYGWEMDSSGTQTSDFTTNDLTPTNSPTLEFGYVDVSTTLTASIGSIVTSIVVTPAEASTTLTASIGTVVLGSISITPSESTTTLTASIGGYFFGPVSISPSAASTTLTASIGAVSASASSANYVVTVSETSYHSVSISETSYHEVTIS